MSEAIEQSRRHLGVPEDGGPFAEAEIRRDDDAGPLIELAQQLEQQRPAGAAERQIRELVELCCAKHNSINVQCADMWSCAANCRNRAGFRRCHVASAIRCAILDAD